MTTDNETPEQQLQQDAEETPEQGERPSLWRRAANTAGQGLRSAGRGFSDASRSTGQVIQRSSEVLTGADLRRFDEFTEAVTRVVVGLHQDQADIDQRVAQLEQESADIRQFQTELAGRMAQLEQERKGRNSGGFLLRVWRSLFR